MPETQEYQPAQNATFELPNTVPTNEKGERIGTGAIIEMRGTRPGSAKESILQAVLRAVTRYGRTMQQPQGAEERQTLTSVRLQLQQEASTVKQWAENHQSGRSYVTDQERAALAAKKQQTVTNQPSVA